MDTLYLKYNADSFDESPPSFPAFSGDPYLDEDRTLYPDCFDPHFRFLPFAGFFWPGQPWPAPPPLGGDEPL